MRSLNVFCLFENKETQTFNVLMCTDNTCNFFEIRYFFLGIILGLCCFTGKISADERKMYKYRRRMGNQFSVKLRREQIG